MWTKVKPLMQFFYYTQVHVLNSPYGAVIKQNFRDEFVDVLHFLQVVKVKQEFSQSFATNL